MEQSAQLEVPDRGRWARLPSLAPQQDAPRLGRIDAAVALQPLVPRR